MKLLHAPVVETGGGIAAKATETGKSPLEAAVTKLFPEEPGDNAAGAAPDKKLETEKQPDAKADGETVDLSHAAGVKPEDETPETTAEIEAGAKERGVTVEQHRKDLAAEQTRLDAITAKTGETAEQIYEREEKDGKPTDLEAAAAKGKTFTQEETEAIVAKRVKKLAAENEDLKRQLSEKPQAAAVGELDQQEATAQNGLDQADDLMEQLRSDPASVEEVLRKYLGAQADKMDLSPAGMRTILRNAKKGFEKTLQTVGQQREADRASRSVTSKLLAEPELVKAVPFLADEDSDDHAQWQQLKKLPQLVNHPRGEYLAAALLLGFKQLAPVVKQIAERQAGKRPAANGHVKLRLKLPRTGGAGGMGKPGKTTFQQAKAKGDVGAMAEALDL